MTVRLDRPDTNAALDAQAPQPWLVRISIRCDAEQQTTGRFEKQSPHVARLKLDNNELGVSGGIYHWGKRCRGRVYQTRVVH